MSSVREHRFPGDPNYHPPGHPEYVPPCAFRHDTNKKDWRCNCRRTFASLDDLSDHVQAYNDARREWELRIRNEAHEKWMARREAS